MRCLIYPFKLSQSSQPPQLAFLSRICIRCPDLGPDPSHLSVCDEYSRLLLLWAGTFMDSDSSNAQTRGHEAHVHIHRLGRHRAENCRRSLAAEAEWRGRAMLWTGGKVYGYKPWRQDQVSLPGCESCGNTDLLSWPDAIRALCAKILGWKRWS